jgi:hypothetical protein
MKSAIVTICVLSVLSVFAQSTDKSYITDSKYFFDSLDIKANISVAAIRSFNKKFIGAANPVWHASAEENTVKFQRDNIRYHVFYSKKGKWKATVKNLSHDQLPKWVVGRIASDFTDYSIFFSQHISTPAGNIYFVKIERGNEWKCVRITRESAEITGEYVRN